MRCEVVAIGTELLLGQIVDTNSSWLGEQLALIGVDSHFQTKVGDNRERIVTTLRTALDRSDAVIVCGGLGPTQDDITRECIVEVMGVELRRHDDLVDHIRRMFESRGREMAANNARQADVPEGATPIPNPKGTAPGLICPIGDKVLYAVPGVPYELHAMFESTIADHLQSRMEVRASIVSRVLRTWGLAESTLAERVAPRLEAVEGTPVTIAFLASGIEGIKVRVTAKAGSEDEARALVEAEEGELRQILGTLVFGVDTDTMESAAGVLLEELGLTLAVAESMTGGLVASRIVDVPGSSAWFRGGVVAYDSEVKYEVLGVPTGCPVITAECAEAMAEGVRKRLGADVGLSITGVAGPATQEDQPVGTAFFGLAFGDEITSQKVQLAGDRTRIRQFGTISLLDVLRRRLLDETTP